jgi:hypothetical protein
MNTRANDGRAQGRHAVVLGGSVAAAFNMLVPPIALFQPRVLFRVLLQFFKSKRSCDEDSNRNHVRSGSMASNQPA